jgi:hypothetical protein
MVEQVENMLGYADPNFGFSSSSSLRQLANASHTGLPFARADPRR